MDKCPLCQRRIADTDRSCECGELLQPWRTITYYGETLRQRGLVLAQRKRYLRACLSFVQACLTNPLDDRSRADVVRSLIHLGQFRDAKELIRLFSVKIPAEEAAALEDAIAELESAEAKQGEDVLKSAEPPGAAAEEPPPRKCLALPLLARRAHVLTRWLPLGGGDALWRTVIQLETADGASDGVWTVLRQAVPDDAVRDYLTGLEHFCRREDAQARDSFAKCLRNKPHVLNAVAYFLYLNLETPHTAADALELLQSFYRGSDLIAVIRAMERQLSDRLRGRRKQVLRHCERRLAGDSGETADAPASAATASAVPALKSAAVDAVAAHAVAEADAGVAVRSDSGQSRPSAVAAVSPEPQTSAGTGGEASAAENTESPDAVLAAEDASATEPESGTGTPHAPLADTTGKKLVE